MTQRAYSIILTFVAMATWNLPCRLASQCPAEKSQKDLTAIYVQAIGDFFNAAKSKFPAFDTVFVGNRKNGEPDDLPDISLPPIIQGVHVKLISMGAATGKMKENKPHL